MCAGDWIIKYKVYIYLKSMWEVNKQVVLIMYNYNVHWAIEINNEVLYIDLI